MQSERILVDNGMTSWLLSVKNTFLEANEDGDSTREGSSIEATIDDTRHINSAGLLFVGGAGSLCSSLSDPQADDFHIADSSATRSCDQMHEANEIQDVNSSTTEHQVEDTEQDKQQTIHETNNVFGFPTANIVVLNVGSMGHGTGYCKPCAFVHNGSHGCMSGESCIFCHLCPVGEKRRRKKERNAQKQAGRAYFWDSSPHMIGSGDTMWGNGMFQWTAS
eukprot:TRINITY_DN18952_c0_g1_i1.p1 TRINITY_DN18952_c0_g1~~TRINITY_DN18952_c0_g1_i1.p1  ORF type:complete len:241 (-),score=48.24 TRINITY_DN18952_c0_g1_i1:66-728(-)